MSYNIGGEFKPEVHAWMGSVQEKPMPIQVNGYPIWELLNPLNFPSIPDIGLKQNHLRNATLNYCNWLRQNYDSSVECTKPSPLPGIVAYPLKDSQFSSYDIRSFLRKN